MYTTYTTYTTKCNKLAQLSAMSVEFFKASNTVNEDILHRKYEKFQYIVSK